MFFWRSLNFHFGYHFGYHSLLRNKKWICDDWEATKGAIFPQLPLAILIKAFHVLAFFWVIVLHMITCSLRWWEELEISTIKVNYRVISANIFSLSILQVLSSQCCHFIPLSCCADNKFCRYWLLWLRYQRFVFWSLAGSIFKNEVQLIVFEGS